MLLKESARFPLTATLSLNSLDSPITKRVEVFVTKVLKPAGRPETLVQDIVTVGGRTFHSANPNILSGGTVGLAG